MTKKKSTKKKDEEKKKKPEKKKEEAKESSVSKFKNPEKIPSKFSRPKGKYNKKPKTTGFNPAQFKTQHKG